MISFEDMHSFDSYHLSYSLMHISVIFRFILNIVWCVFYFNCLIFSLSFSFLPRYIKVFHTIHKYLLILSKELIIIRVSIRFVNTWWKYLMKNLWANFDNMTLKNINGAKKCNSAFIQHFWDIQLKFSWSIFLRAWKWIRSPILIIGQLSELPYHLKRSRLELF